MPSPLPCITLKRGSSLPLHGQLIANGQPEDISGWQVDCWLRTEKDGRVVHRFGVTVTNAPAGQWQAEASAAETRQWPAPADLLADVRYQDGSGRVMHTTNFMLRVRAAQTTPD